MGHDVGKVLLPMCRRLKVDGSRMLNLPRVLEFTRAGPELRLVDLALGLWASP